MMQTDSEETELERLREENRQLRDLLARHETPHKTPSGMEQYAESETQALHNVREDLDQQIRLFDTLLSSIVDFAYVFDREGRFTYVNQALLDLWNLPLQDAVGKNFFDLNYPPALAAQLQRQIETVYETGQTLRDETPYTAPSGATGYYEYIFVPVFDQNGQVEVVAGSTRDISKRYHEQVEKETLFKALQVERERLTSLFLQAPAFIAILRGPDHVFEMANPLYYQLVGQRDIIGKPVREAFPDLEGQGFFEILDEVYRAGQPFIGKDVRIVFEAEADAGSQEHYIDFIYQPLVESGGGISGIFVHGVDLTERKKVEQALQESEERVRLATEAAGLGIWVWEPSTDRVIWENERMYEIYGLSSSDEPLTSAQFMAEIVHPEDAEAFARAITAPFSTGRPLNFSGRFRRKDGELRWIEFWGRLQPASKRSFLRVVGTAADITERKQAEHALEERSREIEGLNSRLRRAMSETHHRVKNNLQVILAMIEVQIMEHQDEQTIPLEEYRQLQAHIHTLAIVHDLLSANVREEEDAQHVSVKAVLDKLLPMLQQTAWNKQVHYSIDDTMLTAKLCIALALILNELVANALKHGNREANVCFRVKDANARLTVSDDGPGFPVGFDPMQAANMGLELVESLVRADLKGQAVYSARPEGGGLVVVTFNLPQNGE